MMMRCPDLAIGGACPMYGFEADRLPDCGHHFGQPECYRPVHRVGLHVHPHQPADLAVLEQRLKLHLLPCRQAREGKGRQRD